MPTSSIIPRPDRAGGILRLTEAVGADPGAGFVFYFRVSSRSQAGKRMKKLEEKAWPAMNDARKIAPDRLRSFFYGVEEGRLSEPRPKLLDAAGTAARRGCLLVTSDLSRFVRAEDYDRRTNRLAWPTDEEFARLREMTKGVPLATVEDPLLSEDERHALATKRTRKAGRPRSIPPELAAEIFDALGCFYETWGGRCRRSRWEVPLKAVAEAFGVSASEIHREADRPSPEGPTWRELARLKAVERGYMVIGENGVIEPKMSFKRGPWRDKPGRPPKWAVRGSR